MKIGVVGCGYVFDIYMGTIARHPGIDIVAVADRNMARARAAGAHYGLRVHDDAAALLADPEIDIVANFTSIESHDEISRAALEAGKHVYSEKPLVTDMGAARALADLAAAKGLRLSCAPSNALSPAVQTLWKATHDGTVGDVRMVYAEFDDNPVYLLKPETWKSASGAPWPYLHEYEMGCTWEHVGYHLTWMCAIFGPVRRVTAFSKHTLPDKTDKPLDPPDTPDFSVACLDFESGVVGRITCSIAVPADHRMRIIGNKGVLSADSYRDYTCPVRVEPFNGVTLSARNLRIVRENTLLQRLTGVGGRTLPLADNPVAGVLPPAPLPRTALKARLKRWLARQKGQQDKCAGLAELAEAIRAGRPHFPSAEFTLHLTELTLAIQAAGPDGASHTPVHRFDPAPMPDRTRAGRDYRPLARPAFLPRLVQGITGKGA